MTIPSAGEDAEQLELIQNCTENLENGLAVSYKSKYTLTIDPAIPLLVVYRAEIKTCVHTKTSPHMFTADLFIIFLPGNNPNAL